MPERLSVAVPLFIDVADVMGSMKCSRSRAYEHMRSALGRKPGERGQSRVPLYVWERYVREKFDPQVRASSFAPPQREAARPQIRMAQPRTKPREVHAEIDRLQSPRVSRGKSAC